MMRIAHSLLLVLGILCANQYEANAYDPIALGLNMSQGMATFQDLKTVNGAEKAWSNGGDVQYDHTVLHRENTEISLLDALVGIVANAEIKSSKTDQAARVGDFNALNALFNGVTILLPNAEFNVDIPWPFTSVDIRLTNMKLINIYFDDMLVSYQRVNANTLDLNLEIQNLDVDITLDWWYDFGWTSSGKASGSSRDSDINLKLRFTTSGSFEQNPPSAVSVPSCVPTLSISNLNFQGSVDATIANWFKSSIASLIEEEVSTLACDELKKASDGVISTSLASLVNDVRVYFDHVPVDPLALEQALVSGTTTNMLDLQSPQNDLGVLAKQGFDMVVEMMDVSRINTMIQDNLLDQSGVMKVELNTMAFLNEGVLYSGQDMLTETTIKLTEVRLKGLDSLKKLELFRAIGKHTLSTELEWDTLDIEADLELNMKPSTSDASVIVNPSTPSVVETVTITTGLRNIKVGAAVLMLLDLEKMNQVELGSLLFTERILGCVLSTVNRLEFSSLILELQDIITPQMSGFLSPGIDRVVNTAVQAAFVMFKPSLLRALPGVMDTTVKDMLNSQIQSMLTDSNECVKVDMKSVLTYGSTLNFNYLFQEGVGPYGDVLGMVKSTLDTTDFNSIIRSFTNGTGTLSLGDVFELKTSEVKFGGISEIEISLTDAKVENLDSLAQPQLFDPLRSDVLRNDLIVGENPKPLLGGARVKLRLLGDGIAIENDFRISISLEKVEALADLLARIQAQQFLTLNVNEIVGVDCLVASMHNAKDPSATIAAIEQLLLAIRKVHLDVTCIECSSPLLPEISSRLATPEGQVEIQQVTDYLLNKTTSLVTSDYNSIRIAHEVEQSYLKCLDPNHEKQEYSSDFSPEKIVPEMGFLMSAGVVIFTLISLVAVIVCCVRTHRRTVVEAKTNWKKTLRAVRAAQSKKETEILKKYGSSMFTSKQIPVALRVLIPIIIVINILLFVSGHLSLGATVKLALDLMGEKVHVDGFFTFSMAKSTIDMYNAGAVELAVLLVIFSGVWPYVKQLIVLFLWFAPVSLVSPKKRGSVFETLDSLGKWSALDIYVLVVALIAFRLSIKPPASQVHPEGLYNVNLFVVPMVGLYANLLAQVLSQIISHYIIYSNRNVIAAARQAYESKESTKQLDAVSYNQYTGIEVEIASETDCRRRDEMRRAIRERVSVRKHLYDTGRNDGTVSRLPSWFSMLVTFVGAVFVPLSILIAVGVPSLRLTTKGLVGVLIEAGESGSNVKEYSFYDIASVIVGQAFELDHMRDYIGLLSLTAIFSFASIIVPVLQSLTLVLIYWKSFSLVGLKRVLTLHEILAAWQWFEVFLVSAVVASLQLGDISGFMVEEFCTDEINSIFGQMIDLDLIEPEDGKCFAVEAVILPICYVLLAAGIALALMARFVSGYASASIEDRQRSLTSHYRQQMAQVSSLPVQEGTLRALVRTFGHMYSYPSSDTKDVERRGSLQGAPSPSTSCVQLIDANGRAIFVKTNTGIESNEDSAVVLLKSSAVSKKKQSPRFAPPPVPRVRGSELRRRSSVASADFPSGRPKIAPPPRPKPKSNKKGPKLPPPPPPKLKKKLSPVARSAYEDDEL